MDYRAALLGLLPPYRTNGGENMQSPKSLPYRLAEADEISPTKCQQHQASGRPHQTQHAFVRLCGHRDYRAALLNILPKASPEQLRAQREKANETSGFLKLPAELRNKIYLDVAHSGSLVRLCKGGKVFSQADFSLLHLCRDVRKDTIPIYFGANRYSFDLTLKINYERARAFLLGLPAEAIASIRKLYFQAEAICRCRNSTGQASCMTIYVYIDADEWRRNGVTYGFTTKYAFKKGPCEKKEIENRTPANVKAILKRMVEACKTQSLQRDDLRALLDALKPLSSYSVA